MRRDAAPAAWPSRWRSLDAAGRLLTQGQALAGKHVLVTSGPTHEPIDPVRYIANRSSGKQGHAIAAAAAARRRRGDAGVSGPVNVPDPPGVTTMSRRDRARDAAGGRARAAGRCCDFRRRRRRLARRQCEPSRRSRRPRARACRRSPWPKIPTSWRPLRISRPSGRSWSSALPPRPKTSSPMPRPSSPRKGCDWIVANDVSPRPASWAAIATPSMLVTAKGVEAWPPQSKDDVAAMLIARIADALQETT